MPHFGDEPHFRWREGIILWECKPRFEEATVTLIREFSRCAGVHYKAEEVRTRACPVVYSDCYESDRLRWQRQRPAALLWHLPDEHDFPLEQIAVVDEAY